MKKDSDRKHEEKYRWEEEGLIMVEKKRDNVESILPESDFSKSLSQKFGTSTTLARPSGSRVSQFFDPLNAMTIQ